MESLCLEIDSLVVEYFDILCAFQSRLSHLHLQLNGGFFNITQAKYVMGPGKLSQYQYDQRMQATTRLEQESLAKMRLSTARTVLEIPSSTPPSSPGLERRRLLYPSFDNANLDHINLGVSNDDIRMDRIRKPSTPETRDPISWFGVLVPPALRNAQTSFRNALVDIVELANLRAELFAKEEQLARMLDRKKQLLSA